MSTTSWHDFAKARVELTDRLLPDARWIPVAISFHTFLVESSNVNKLNRLNEFKIVLTSLTIVLSYRQ